MIITGIFLFLLGTKFGGSVPTPVRTEVKYEGPNKITITEDTGNDRILPGNIPQSGPNFIQQGSNFYFNPILPTAMIPQIVEQIIPTVQNNIVVTKPEIDALVEEKPIALDPLIEVEPAKVAENWKPEVIVPEVLIPEVVPEVVIPDVIETVRIPDEVEVQVQPLPFIPEAPELPGLVIPELPLPISPVEVNELPVSEPKCVIPVESEIDIPVSPVIVKEPVIEVIEPIAPVIIPEAPELPPLVFPELPLQVPDLIVEPIVPEVSIPVLPDVEIAAPVFAPEIDITLNEIPSPPELPPLVLVEKPTIVEDKTVIMIPAAPALPIEAIVPPEVVVENSVLPTICVRNIVLDRVLPRIIYEKTQKVELISFPSARIVPVAAKIDRPILTLVSRQ